MDHPRVERLLAELATRYGNNQRFLDGVRPMVAKILHEPMPEDRRTELMEMLAETCMRDAQIERDCEAAKRSWQALFASLAGHMERLTEIARRAADDRARNRRRESDLDHGIEGLEGA